MYRSYFEIVWNYENNFEELTFGKNNYSNIDYIFYKISYQKTQKIILETEQNNTEFLISYISESNYNIFPAKIQELEFNTIQDSKIIRPSNYSILLIYFLKPFEETSIEFIDKRTFKDIQLNDVYDINDEFTYYRLNLYFESIKNNEILILSYDFEQEFSSKIIINNDEYYNEIYIDNKIKGSTYLELCTKKIYTFNFEKMQNNNIGHFKIISTGNIFQMSIINQSSLINFDEMITQKETSPLIINVDILNQDYIIKIDINSENNEEISKIVSIKKDNKNFIESLNNYYIFEKNVSYIIQITPIPIPNPQSPIPNKSINPLKKQDLYIFSKINIQPIDYNNINNLILGKISYVDKFDKFIKINYTEIPYFEIINNNPQKTQYAIANINETQYNNFPLNINKIKFNKLSKLAIRKHLNYFFAILIINLSEEKIDISFKEISGPSYIDLNNSNYLINSEHNSFLINYEKPSTNDEIIIVNYLFNENKSVKIIIERLNSEDEIININNKQKGSFYFNVKNNGELLINFEELLFNNSNNNNNNNININEGSLVGEFNIISTGKEFNIDIAQNIISFNELKSSIQPSPLLFYFDSLNNNYIKKIIIKNNNNDFPSKLLSIKKNKEDNIPILNNYYMFEKNNKYSIQFNFEKNDNDYILNELKMIEFSEKNIERLNESIIRIYNETDINLDLDKFILFNFNNFTKLKVNQKKGISLFNKAIINETQYNNFPIDIQNIKFEKIDINDIDNIIEIKKQDNYNFGILMINFKEKNNEIEFIFENEKEETGLFNLNIILIFALGFSLIIIIIIVIIIIKRRKRKSENIGERKNNLEHELFQMNEDDEDKLNVN